MLVRATLTLTTCKGQIHLILTDEETQALAQSHRTDKWKNCYYSNPGSLSPESKCLNVRPRTLPGFSVYKIGTVAQYMPTILLSELSKSIHIKTLVLCLVDSSTECNSAECENIVSKCSYLQGAFVPYDIVNFLRMRSVFIHPTNIHRTSTVVQVLCQAL